MLLGMAFTFAAIASLASVAGGWAVQVNQSARTFALVLITLFGLTMLVPTLAGWIAAPVVSLGSRLLRLSARQRVSKHSTTGVTTGSSLLLGIATGLLWAPCAGPVLGLILTGAALRGANIQTSLLLLIYGFGAASSLAAGSLLSGQLLATAKLSARWGEALRRCFGLAVVAGAATIWLGLDTGLFTRWSLVVANSLEQDLIVKIMDGRDLVGGSGALSATYPTLSDPLVAMLAAPQWLNTQPLRSEDVRGKVVVVNFWTYSCVYCLRALPHIRAWAAKYADQGLVVIGVHTPEFAFEKDLPNVRSASASLGVRYPVAIDNDFGIWRAFNNNSWPALYIIGADGQVRRAISGEGGYDHSEQLIQQLLSEADGVDVASDIMAVVGEGPQAAADRTNLRSSETYVGYGLGRTFSSPGGLNEDSPTLYRAAMPLNLNRWSLSGIWTIGSEFATLSDSSGKIAFRFHSRDLHLVLAPPSEGRPVRFRVTIDGAPPKADHGFDVDGQGWGILKDARLYQLIRQTGPIADRTFEIEFYEEGVRAYAFTFG